MIASPRSLEEITFIIPVHNEREYFYALVRRPEWAMASQVIVVDSASETAISLPAHFNADLLRLEEKGVAKARNAAWQKAATPWLVYLDVDCDPEPDWWSAWLKVPSGKLAYAGTIRTRRSNWIARYYDREHMWNPPLVEGAPQFLAGGNMMVARQTLEQVGGFDEGLSAAEDVDLALRIKEIGPLGMAPEAVVWHRARDRWSDFRRRFEKYGEGLGEVARKRGEAWSFGSRPKSNAPLSRILFAQQKRAMRKGYRRSQNTFRK